MLSKFVHTNHISKIITHGNRTYISIGDWYRTGYNLKHYRFGVNNIPFHKTFGKQN